MVANKKEIKLDIYAIDSETAAKSKVIPRKKFWDINREMIRFKVHFFVFVGALGVALPYLAVFAKVRIGMSASSLAAVLTLQQFLCIFTKPLIGYISDYFNKLKAIIAILTLVQGIFCFLLLIIPKIDLNTIDNQSGIEYIPPLDKLNGSAMSTTCHFQPESFSATEKNRFNHTQWTVVCSTSISTLALPNECLANDVHMSSEINHSTIVTTLIEDSVLSTNTSTNRDQINELSKQQDQQISNNSFGDFISMCNQCCGQTGDCYIISCSGLKSHATSTKTASKSDFQTFPFWLFALFSTVAMICINALFTLSDTACCESVQKTGVDFGRMRLWGAVGWGVMAPIGGYLNDFTDDYLAAWIVMAAMSCIALWNIIKLDLVNPSFSNNILKDVGVVLKSKEFLFFEAGVLMNGIFVGIVWFYLIWFLTTIGGSRFLCGLAQTVQCFVGEIPFMFFSGLAIKKFGHFNLMSMSLMAYCVRFFWYSQLHNPWLVLPIEIMHGFTYGFYYPAVANYAKISAKPGTEATTQSILFSTHEGLGAGIGCVLAGIGFDYLGGHMTFLISGIVAGIGTILNVVLTLIIRKRQGGAVVTAASEKSPYVRPNSS